VFILDLCGMRIYWTIFAGLLGLAFGSFLNVCLSRWPEGESVVKPRSRCRACGRTLTWWENVPVVSWLALRGRCRTCGAWIGVRYVVVELAVGLLWAVTAWQHGAPYDIQNLRLTYPPTATVDAVMQMIFLWLLVALAGLDAEHYWLPNLITLPGAAVGFLWTYFEGVKFEQTERDGIGAYSGLAIMLVQILLAASLMLLIRLLYWLVRRQEGMGLGDVKLMAMLAAWLGLGGALLAFFIGVVVGAGMAVAMLLMPKRDETAWGAHKLPLGTFLCVGGIVSSLWGQPIIDAYLRLAGF
jgi:leader peptidase (prepilin peptidase) / N-methyltransferase